MYFYIFLAILFTGIYFILFHKSKRNHVKFKGEIISSFEQYSLANEYLETIVVAKDLERNKRYRFRYSKKHTEKEFSKGLIGEFKAVVYSLREFKGFSKECYLVDLEKDS